MSVLFTILFKKNNGDTFSATFNKPIKLTCKLKYLGLDGTIYDLKYWNRTLNKNSTTYHIIHDAIEISEALTITPGPTPEPTPPPTPPSLCCLNPFKCREILKEVDIMSIVTTQCCGPELKPPDICDYKDPDSCGICLNNTAHFAGINTNKTNVNSNIQTKGNFISFDIGLTILLKGNNLLISDGSNAVRILLEQTIDGSSNMYINSKLYEQPKNIEYCLANKQSVCPQVFDGSKSTMNILDQKCCYNDPIQCNTCLNNLAKENKIIYKYNPLSVIGSSISLNYRTTVLLKDKKLVITDATNNAIAVELLY